MISVSDNFLSSPELEYHRNILLSKVNNDTLQSIGMWMNSYEMESGDSKDIHKKLGIVWKTTCEKIQTYFLDTLNIEVEPYSIRYQCMTDRYIIHPHLDGSVREKSLDASYTSILYLNDTNTFFSFLLYIIFKSTIFIFFPKIMNTRILI